jgi:hypothetical protein
MNTDKDQGRHSNEQNDQKQETAQQPRSSAFNETRQRDEKSTSNIEEEAHLEQQRKEAMTERD